MKYNYYLVRYTTLHNKEIVGNCHYEYVISEQPPMMRQVINFTWETLAELYKKYTFFLEFNIWHFKKGRRVSFFNTNLFHQNDWDIKEWKKLDLNISLSIEYVLLRDPSIDTILHHPNSENAMKYLLERKENFLSKTLDKQP